MPASLYVLPDQLPPHHVSHPLNRCFGVMSEVAVAHHGHLGGPGFRKLATIGDTVNVAARIESANKQLAVRHALPSVGAVLEAAGSALVFGREFLTPLRGKSGRYRLYEAIPQD